MENFSSNNEMQSKDKQMNLRISSELKARIEFSKKKNKRSINSEVIYLIEKGLLADEAVDDTGMDLSSYNTEHLLHELTKRFKSQHMTLYIKHDQE